MAVKLNAHIYIYMGIYHCHSLAKVQRNLPKPKLLGTNFCARNRQLSGLYRYN